MAKIKICGLTRIMDIEAVNKTLPDYIGFVFARSKRQINENKAKVLKAYLNPSIKTVGVFVNEEIENIIKLCKSGVIDIIQLHGDEDEDYVNELKKHISNNIIKAIRVKSKQDIRDALEFPCDYLLLDTYHEKKYGGIGKTFDWSYITDLNKPYFLAGGINSTNVIRAIRHHKPYCIDVSSGVEVNGYKDPAKIMEMVAMVRQV
ncbi:MAG: phosphoribosylanthranilate isomerase [Clostridiaceae bacterium]|nr:phosphoribosylanthranilate isomerase [Clostridiaceae bacterium]